MLLRREQPWKAFIPIVTSPSANVTVVRAVQPEKVFSGIDVREVHLLISTVLRDVHCSKTPVVRNPSVVRDAGSVTGVSDEH